MADGFMNNEAITLEQGQLADLEQIVAIYNGYILDTAITFDLKPYTVDTRRPWFDQFSDHQRHQLWVAKQGDRVLGYAASMPFRGKAAYDPSVEDSLYLRPDAKGLGLGKRLLQHLLMQLAGQDVHQVLACITLPNDVSVGLHQALGFKPCGTFHEVGRKFERYHDVMWLEYTVPQQG